MLEEKELFSFQFILNLNAANNPGNHGSTHCGSVFHGGGRL